jgi:hypothetical protein
MIHFDAVTRAHLELGGNPLPSLVSVAWRAHTQDRCLYDEINPDQATTFQTFLSRKGIGLTARRYPKDAFGLRDDSRRDGQRK